MHKQVKLWRLIICRVDQYPSARTRWDEQQSDVGLRI